MAVVGGYVKAMAPWIGNKDIMHSDYAAAAKHVEAVSSNILNGDVDEMVERINISPHVDTVVPYCAVASSELIAVEGQIIDLDMLIV